jgi:hypothetical protein
LINAVIRQEREPTRGEYGYKYYGQGDIRMIRGRSGHGSYGNEGGSILGRGNSKR